MRLRISTAYRLPVGVLFLGLSMLVVAAESGDVNTPAQVTPAPPKVDELDQISEAIGKIKQEYVDPVDDSSLIAACRERMLRLVSDRSNSLASTSVELSTSKSAHEAIAEIFTSIKRQYPQATTVRQLRDACLQGMLKALDPWSAFLDEEDFKALFSRATAGVGVEIDIVANRPRVVAPIEGGPAHRAGIKIGDVIVMIDHVSADGLSLGAVVNRLLGVLGSSIALTIEREGAQVPLEFVLTREVVRNENITWRFVAPGYAYIRIRQFLETTIRDLARAIEASYRGSQGDLKGLILDVRSNPGGLLPSCVGVAAAFLPANALILETKGRTINRSMRLSASPTNYTRSGAPDALKGLPANIKTVQMAVLVNHGSASGSEIVAAALQDHRRATIFGVRTFGQGTVQTIWPLKGNTGLKLTSARFFRPSGNAIEAIGVTPDVILEETERTFFGSEADLQLGQAVKILGRESKPPTIPGASDGQGRGLVAVGPSEDADAAYKNGDYATALRLWRDLAQQGDASAQTRLGEMYRDGRGVTLDDAAAVQWFRKAAEQGNALGQYDLGFMYETGRGVAKDDKQAVDWFRKAAEQGHANAQTSLGYMYANGRGVAKDDTEAVKWYRKAAEQGNAFGQNNLGVMYRDGRGITQNESVAVSWFRKAAEQGNAIAQDNLGGMYAQGRGVAKDDAEAVQWYRKAAEQGNASAETNLGYMYETGRGVTKDEAQAVQWYRKAAEQKDSNAQAILSSIEARRDLADLSRTVAELVKANEKDLPSTPVLDAERARLAREVIDASRVRERLINSPERLNEGLAAQRTPTNMSPKLLEAIRVTAIASFRSDRILATMERRLAESLDAATLQVGLQWERSDVGRHMYRLDLESETPERRTAMKEFARELVSKGGSTNEPRARACAQADTLANQTDAMLPLLEAVIAGVMIGRAQQPPAMDMDGIRRAVVAVRPMLREATRQSVLAECLFTYQDLSDAEVEQWLEFLRSDSGGRYARGFNDALRDAMLDRAEVFARTLVEVARQIKGRGDA